VRLVIKVGGAQLEEASARAELVRSVAQARMAGLEIVLVHGGGNQIRSLVRKLSLPERYHEGLRITDADTAEVVLMVLAGLVSKSLAAAFEEQGVRAVGLCGADGSTFSSVPERRSGVDLGYVGAVGNADPRLVETLLAEGYLPLIATVAPLARERTGPLEHEGAPNGTRNPESGPFYNVNADLAAGPLAKALSAQALLFLTDVPGVLDAEGRSIASLSPERCADLRAGGVIHGGMIPKVEAALAALEENPNALVKIAPAAGASAVLAALDPEVGTRFIAREEAWTNTY
jgi:acetylglutamate kinase